VSPDTSGKTYPFNGTTEYRKEYVPKDPMPLLPPLTGKHNQLCIILLVSLAHHIFADVVSRDGLAIPFPRRSLGLRFWHKGYSDKYFVLIPRHMDAPCSASQIFTTLHDNQEEACIIIVYGDDPVASNNLLLGQVSIC
jgi:hypothetical protein